ncbi:aldehyde dehydrogenase [Nonlabens ponticola]|uniref:Aldehyde dehydrogenase n=1 Tax=Nonlabens ponticola TaxID=2496866 RepID=A0A3S9MYN5_9FLAO|nr:aldehyde dehydrogenase [Nonlabens ponticola]AZQ44234.1 aldehyde dehydrogenase [Nonlabens ponticola]
MTPQELHKLQRSHFDSRKTYDLNYRIAALKKLKNVLIDQEQEVYKALASDLAKSEFESFVTEYQVVLKEVDRYIKKTPQWARPIKVSSSLLNFPSSARKYPEPYGCTLIIAPWNYPFQLAMAPLIGAIAAGNTVTLKPSEFSPATSDLLKNIIEQSFELGHASVILGDGEIAQQLTSLQWDYIFFTGSPAVGKKIYQAAAQFMTPVTLELGGKNPAVIHESADVNVCAQRIVWAKFLNAGQTCIAPDYLVVHESIKQPLIDAISKYITQFFGDNVKSSPDYPRIIREQHFDSLVELLQGEDISIGGDHDKDNLYIAPTVVNEPTRDSKVMQQEIFGPILPVVTYKDKQDIVTWIESYEKPLGAYVYTSDKKFSKWFLNRFSFGGGAVNDSIVQFVNERLPFGGVGNSGIGSYHGKDTFKTFSHYKSVVHRGTWLDIPVKYPPYKGKLSVTKKFLKWF